MIAATLSTGTFLQEMWPTMAVMTATAIFVLWRASLGNSRGFGKPAWPFYRPKLYPKR
jgi:uncharacterized membrane protein YccC